MDEGSLRRQLDVHWSLDDLLLERLHGGMNSVTYAIRPASTNRPSFVAKWVSPQLVDDLVVGCQTAAELAAHGLTTGEPVRTRDGQLTAPVAGGALALLRPVSGSGLTGEDARQRRLIGETLARVHAVTRSAPRRGGFDGWLEPDPRAAEQVPWLTAALAQVRSEFDALPELSWATLHTDPAPEAFLLDEATERVGIIDWTGSRSGPVLYDIASAVMYLGGLESSGEFLDAYDAEGVLQVGELEHLDALRRFRWGVQATYFARRLVTEDRTGLADEPCGNAKGLDDARRGLESLGVHCGR